MLYLVGLGLNCRDISLNALESIKKCRKIYLENYTSSGNSAKEFEKLTCKKFILANRKLIENDSNQLLEEAKKQDIAILSYGDPLAATTHINYLIGCRKQGIKIKVIHSSSILTAIGETGLFLYNFGKIASIPFNNKDVKVPIKILKDNLSLGMHTLFLLDLDPENKKFLAINDALDYLLKNKIDLNCAACSALGTEKQEINYGKIKDLIKLKFNKFPQCVIIPGKLHFIEKEALNLWKK